MVLRSVLIKGTWYSHELSFSSGCRVSSQLLAGRGMADLQLQCMLERVIGFVRIIVKGSM